MTGPKWEPLSFMQCNGRSGIRRADDNRRCMNEVVHSYRHWPEGIFKKHFRPLGQHASPDKTATLFVQPNVSSLSLGTSHCRHPLAASGFSFWVTSCCELHLLPSAWLWTKHRGVTRGLLHKGALLPKSSQRLADIVCQRVSQNSDFCERTSRAVVIIVLESKPFLKHQNALTTSVFEASKLVSTKTLWLKCYYRHQGFLSSAERSKIRSSHCSHNHGCWVDVWTRKALPGVLLRAVVACPSSLLLVTIPLTGLVDRDSSGLADLADEERKQNGTLADQVTVLCCWPLLLVFFH